MGKINILSADLINKIAAGEVIERPASVIKELLENSIDAGAENITIRLEKGGIQLIEVSDDGFGMDKTDAKKAFIQHATSKISSESDLEQIGSFGFRGEALASIASVAQTEIHTFDGKSEPIKSFVQKGEIYVEPGQGRNNGTTVTVRNIFHTIPARRKFLKNEATEYRHILDAFTNIALANYKIGFQLYKDGSLAEDLPGCENLGSRIQQIYGEKVINNLLPINYQGPNLHLTGYIGHPTLAAERSAKQHVFLNKRPIADKLIAKAIKDGYASTIAPGLKPVFIIFIEISPEEVDVNVHPRKLEVRFVNQRNIYSAVYHSTKDTLERHLQQQLVRNVRENSNFNNAAVQTTLNDHVSSNPPQFSFGPTRQSENHQNQNYVSQSFVSEITDVTNIHEFQTFDFLQIFNTYLTFAKDEKMVVIDQHAADERIRFEALEAELNNEGLEQVNLLIPTDLNLASSQKAKLIEFKDKLKLFGFEISEFSGNSLQLTAVPLILKDKDYSAALNEIISELEVDSAAISSAMLNKAIATLACHSSVRAGQQLTKEEALALINKLFKCKLPYSCPHGRPIIWEISRYELEKQFKRKV